MIGITGLLVIVALFTFVINPKKGKEEKIVAPEEGCCGAHAICEKGLKKIDKQIDYFEDEELDKYRGINAGDYSDQEVDEFREVLYTLRQGEVGDWLVSLEKREIQLPEILKAEALDLLKE